MRNCARLEAYLAASGRGNVLGANGPLWTRHDRAGRSGQALTSHAFAKNLKRYAIAANLGDLHLHQTRHSFARIASRRDGLNHRNARRPQPQQPGHYARLCAAHHRQTRPAQRADCAQSPQANKLT